MRRRLTGFRYLIDDARYAAGRVLRFLGRRTRSLGNWAGDRWATLEVYTQRRLAAAGAVAAGAAFIWFVLVPAAPCQFPGGDRCPPGDDAEELAPASAIAYLHANLDPGTEQASRANELGNELPTLAAELRRLITTIPGLGLDLGSWFAGEIATVLLPPGEGSDELRTVVLFEADETRGARAFFRELLGPERRTERRRGIAIESAGGQAAALVEGFLAVGEESAITQVIDTAAGERPSLAGDDTAAGVRDRLPDDRIGDAFVSRTGAGRLLRPGAGALSLFEPFVNPTAAVAAAGALEMTEDGLELVVVSEQDSDRAERRPGFFGAFEPFEPELPRRLAPGTLAYLGLGRPAEGARELIASAAESAPALSAAVEALARDLARQSRISLVDQVLPLLGDEAAISVGPRGRPTGGAVPYLSLLTRGIDEERARKDLARLEGPIAEALGVAGGAFTEAEVGGIEARTLRVSPTLDFAYAVFDGLFVLGTQRDAIEAARGDDSLADANVFQAVTGNLGGTPAALLFADLGGLVDLGEQAGLAEDPAYAIFASDLRRLRGLGLIVSRAGDTLATRLRLLID